MKTASTSARRTSSRRAEDGVRRRVAHGKMPDAREDVAVLHEQIAQLAVKRLVPARLRRTLEGEGRILVRQNTIHRIHHVDEPHMRISSVRSLVRPPRPSHKRLPSSIARARRRDRGAFMPRRFRRRPPRPTRRAPRGATTAAATDHADATRAALDVMARGRQRRRRRDRRRARARRREPVGERHRRRRLRARLHGERREGHRPRLPRDGAGVVLHRGALAGEEADRSARRRIASGGPGRVVVGGRSRRAGGARAARRATSGSARSRTTPRRPSRSRRTAST